MQIIFRARLINESKSGWVVEPENIDILANIMREAYLSEKSELEEKGKNGFNFAMEKLSKNNNLRQLVNYILQ